MKKESLIPVSPLFKILGLIGLLRFVEDKTTNLLTGEGKAIDLIVTSIPTAVVFSFQHNLINEEVCDYPKSSLRFFLGSVLKVLGIILVTTNVSYVLWEYVIPPKGAYMNIWFYFCSIFLAFWILRNDVIDRFFIRKIFLGNLFIALLELAPYIDQVFGVTKTG